MYPVSQAFLEAVRRKTRKYYWTGRISTTVYRNPYWPTWPLLQITQGCTHNSCKFCTMYKDVQFKLQPMEWIEEDLRELAEMDPHVKTIQLLSAGAVLEGDVDAILLTGGISRDLNLTDRIQKMCSYLAPVEVIAGEFEMEALAAGAYRVLSGEEPEREYKKNFTFTGIEDLLTEYEGI